MKSAMFGRPTGASGDTPSSGCAEQCAGKSQARLQTTGVPRIHEYRSVVRQETIPIGQRSGAGVACCGLDPREWTKPSGSARWPRRPARTAYDDVAGQFGGHAAFRAGQGNRLGPRALHVAWDEAPARVFPREPTRRTRWNGTTITCCIVLAARAMRMRSANRAPEQQPAAEDEVAAHQVHEAHHVERRDRDAPAPRSGSHVRGAEPDEDRDQQHGARAAAAGCRTRSSSRARAAAPQRQARARCPTPRLRRRARRCPDHRPARRVRVRAVGNSPSSDTACSSERTSQSSRSMYRY